MAAEPLKAEDVTPELARTLSHEDLVTEFWGFSEEASLALRDGKTVKAQTLRKARRVMEAELRRDP